MAAVVTVTVAHHCRRSSNQRALATGWVGGRKTCYETQKQTHWSHTEVPQSRKDRSKSGVPRTSLRSRREASTALPSATKDQPRCSVCGLPPNHRTRCLVLYLPDRFPRGNLGDTGKYSEPRKGLRSRTQARRWLKGDTTTEEESTFNNTQGDILRGAAAGLAGTHPSHSWRRCILVCSDRCWVPRTPCSCRRCDGTQLGKQATNGQFFSCQSRGGQTFVGYVANMLL